MYYAYTTYNSGRIIFWNLKVNVGDYLEFLDEKMHHTQSEVIRVEQVVCKLKKKI